MALAKLKTPLLPTPAEMRLLQALWALGEATVEELVNSFPPQETPNYKTAQTILRIMETKGFIDHTPRGKVFVFHPILTQSEAASLSVRALMRQNFGGSIRGLFMNLLQAEALKPGELEEIELLIRDYRESKDSTEPAQ